jgi:hypothetical protein
VAERCRVLVAKLAAIPETARPERIRQLYAWILQRAPTPSQLARAEEFLQAASAQEEPAAAKLSSPPAQPLNPWEQLAQVLFFSNDFLFID